MKIFRILSLIFFGVVCFLSAAAAGAYDSIGEAQSYGISGVNLSAEEFLAPWRSYEEHAPQLNNDSDRAYCYTPYLVVASDAWQKASRHQLVFLNDGEKIWQDYAGFLTFAVQLYLKDPEIPKNFSVWIEQKQSKIYSYQARLPAATQKITAASSEKPIKPVYLFTGYYYFMDDSIRHDSPLVLVAATNDKHYRFYFDMKGIR